MKKTMMLIIMTISVFVNAQSAFDKGMQKGFEYWSKGENDKAIAIFDRVAQAEKTKWIPYYYSAQVGITSSFSEKDKTKVMQILSKASISIDSAMSISKDNSEVYTLNGLLLTAYVASDPMANGAKLSGKTIMMYEKAIKLDSTNPRPYYLKAQFGMGAARFFKQDLSAFCKEISDSIKKFDNFTIKEKYYPNWGKKQALAILESNDCKVLKSNKEKK